MSQDTWAKKAVDLVLTKKLIFLTGRIDRETEATFLTALFAAWEAGVTEVTLVIDSNGGDYGAAVAIANWMRMSGVTFTGIVVSEARSSALVIFMACHRRLACLGAELLAHWGQTALTNDEQRAVNGGDAERALARVREQNKAMVEAIQAASELTREIQELCDHQCVITAAEACRLGLVHQVLNTFNPDFKGL